MHTLWVWLAEPPGKTPYTVGYAFRPGDMATPLVHPRRDLMEKMAPVARAHEELSGDPVRLVRFDEAAP